MLARVHRILGFRIFQSQSSLFESEWRDSSSFSSVCSICTASAAAACLSANIYIQKPSSYSSSLATRSILFFSKINRILII